MDYEPLDLSSVANALQAQIPGGAPSPIGKTLFHGLPFQIGTDPEKPCCLLLETNEPKAVSVQRDVQWLIFAHQLLESHLFEGEPIGLLIAHYVFHYADGKSLAVPIRERFEIDKLPARWGELPFLAVPDHPDGINSNRYEGRWDNAGYRQTEATQAGASNYYLWAWKNPRPEVTVNHVEILPNKEIFRRFLIGAITMSSLEEEPFRRTASVPVKLTLPQEEDAQKPFGLEAKVDRGVATYAYPLSPDSPETYLADPKKGWGQAKNSKSSPAYVQIAANPSATVKVTQNEKEIGSANWGELEAKGVVETERVRFEIMDTGRNWIHTTVVDDDTGKPVPCRVHFRTPAGIPFAPHGHHPHVHSDMGTWHFDIGGDVRLGHISYAYIDGKCQGWLPRGEAIVDVSRGFEYEPLRTKVEIKPGQRELELRLKRHSNLNAERYFSGDTHVHFLSTQGALTEAAAEDLDVVNLLLSQWGHLFTNTEEFTGHPVRSGDGETIVYATQENRQHLLGHLTLLGLKEPVMPWCSDGPSEAELGGNLETTLSHWADACHAQGGTVVIPHLPVPNGEPATLIATGRADAVEMLQHNAFFHLEYYRYLNGGYRLPLAGGTDKMDSGVPVGIYRTYAYIPPDEPFTYDNWCKALRSGNTFLSGGPLLRFTVNGRPVGSEIKLGRDGGTVEVEAIVTSIFPVHSLEIVQGAKAGSGQIFKVVGSVEDKNGVKELRLRTTLKITDTTWLCARCGGPNYTSIPHLDSWGRGVFAHTSPVYLACGDTYNLSNPDTLHYMLTLVDGSLEYIRKRAPQWRPGTVTHHHGQEDHQAFLESPFHEAIHAIHQKMHDLNIPH